MKRFTSIFINISIAIIIWFAREKIGNDLLTGLGIGVFLNAAFMLFIIERLVRQPVTVKKWNPIDETIEHA